MSLVNWVHFPQRGDERGYITIIESGKTIPFNFKRVYYLTALSSDFPRGFHAHKKLQQVAVCISGKCNVLLDNGSEKEWVTLDSPSQGLIIDPMIWHEMHQFSSDCVFLVFASEYYEESDYIRDYLTFCSEVNQ